MNLRPRFDFRTLMDSSAVVVASRTMAEGSAACVAGAAAVRWLRRTRERIVVGLGGRWSGEQEVRTTEQIEALGADSRVVAALSSLATAASAARHGTRVRRLLDPVLSLDLLARVRMAGGVVVIAVLTHTILLGVLGVRVQALGWGIRVGLVAASLIVVWRPGAMAAAWRDRPAQRATGASRSSGSGDI